MLLWMSIEVHNCRNVKISSYVRVRVCMFVCAYTYLYIDTHVSIYSCLCVCPYLSLSLSVSIYLSIYVYLSIYQSVYIYLSLYIYIYIWTLYIQTNAYFDIYIHIHSDINTLVYISSSSSGRATGTEYPWPSLATSPYRSSPLVGLQGYIRYPHIAPECMFELVVLLLPGHMWGSIGIHHWWARPCFSSSVLHVWFV